MKANTSMVISVGRDGTTQGLYMDSMTLKSVGRQDVQRATDISFNNATQLFDVYMLPECTRLVSSSDFPEYELARKFEVTYLNTCRLAGVDKFSPEGLGLAYIARLHTDSLTLNEEDTLSAHNLILAKLTAIRGDVPWANLLGLEA
jgi:hypothetical protein